MKVSQNDGVAKAIIEQSLNVSIAHPFVGLIIDDGETLAAAFIFNNFDRINIDLSIVVQAPFTMRLMRDIARYVFGRLGVKRVTCVTSVDNSQAIKRLRRLGFEQEGVLRDRLPTGDAFVFSLLARDQKFVKL